MGKKFLGALASLTVLMALVTAPSAVAVSAPEKCLFTETVVIELDAQPGVKRGFDGVVGTLQDRPSRKQVQCSSDPTAATAFGSKTFLPSSPWYNYTDSNSQFTAQTTFTSAGYPTAFGFKLSGALVAISTGPMITANSYKGPGNCTYNKPGVDPSYFFHWSCPNKSLGTSYPAYGTWRFPINVSGYTGTATVQWNFNYVIYTRIT